MKKLLLFVFTSVLFSAVPTPPSFRLPAETAPTHYQLDLTLDPAKNDFSGTVTIDLAVRKPVAVIWLNASELSIKTASVTQGSSDQNAQILPGGEDFAGFSLSKPLTVGSARLKVEFSGKVHLNSGAGVFLSKRNDDRYLFTQFEPIDARSAFPCFDEPSYKTPWQVVLHVPKDQVAVSNTAVQSETDEAPSMKKVVFGETKPLPSYLVAFGVGPLQFVDGGTACKKKVPVRIVVPRGDEARAKYAAEVTAAILTKLEEYFDIPYPYEKADQVSIPLSFGGAMENPGLVTYDSAIILAPPQGGDPLERQREYASVAAHELAHQWFGDLVTMAWWNDTWLNESFATFVSQEILIGWKPEWQTNVDDQTTRTNAMWLDRLATARRIDQPVEVKQDIANAFDGITYIKGGSVLEMFNHSMGAEKFRAASRLYLRSHAYANGTSADFLNALGEMGGPEVPASFKTFLQQPGVPEISMQLKCGTGAPQIEMSQQRFWPLGASQTDNQMWKLPVCVAFDKDGQRGRSCASMNEKTFRMSLPTSSCPAWFEGNADGSGYYYTGYEAPALEKLVAHRSNLSLAEQVGLFGESKNMMGAGKTLPSENLKLATLLKDDAKRQVISAAIDLAQVRLDFLPENLRPKYTQYVEENFGARARRLGWTPKPDDSEDDRLIRNQLVGFVAQQGRDPELLASAQTLTQNWLNSRAPLPSETIASIFSAAASNGDAALHESMLAAFKKEKDEFFQSALLSGLGAFRQKALVEENLQFLIKGDADWRVAYPLVFAPLSHPEVAKIPLETIEANYQTVITHMPSSAGSDFRGFLPSTGSMGCSAQESQDLNTFFAPRLAKVNGGPRNLAHVVEQINLCVARKQAQQADLIDYFQKM